MDSITNKPKSLGEVRKTLGEQGGRIEESVIRQMAIQCSRSANRWSAVRMALAMMVSEGFTALAETKQEASTT